MSFMNKFHKKNVLENEESNILEEEISTIHELIFRLSLDLREICDNCE